MNILDGKKNKLIFEVDAGHTLCNILKDELYNDEKVRVASYTIDHPLIGKPRMIIETSGDDVRGIVLDAVQRLKKKNERFEKEIIKELK